MNNTITVTQPSMPPLEEFNEYLKDIWDRKWLTNNGHYHQELEKALCEYLGVKYISLFSNGTLALITALQCLRITGEVITTPFSFVATTHSLWWNGIKPVFADIDPVDFNLDPAKIEAAITPKTTAIMPVHVYGTPCKVKQIKEIAETYGLRVIYDAAHAFNTEIDGTSVHNFGDMSVVSFHATKVYNTFEGGAIICHDEATKKRIDNLKNFGFVGETTVIAPGINAKMNEVQAAFGLLQLKYVDGLIKKREDSYNYYNENFKDIKGISLLKVPENVKSSYSYYPIIIDKNIFGSTRDDVYNRLKENNILSRRYFYPLISQFPTYKGLESASPSNLPVAERVAKQVLCLPFYPDLTNDDMDRIIKIILKSV